MKSFEEKIGFFNAILDQEEYSYADSFNGHICVAGLNVDYQFLKSLESEEEIKEWIEKLKSRIVLREDDAVLEDIIDDYMLCG